MACAPPAKSWRVPQGFFPVDVSTLHPLNQQTNNSTSWKAAYPTSLHVQINALSRGSAELSAVCLLTGRMMSDGRGGGRSLPSWGGAALWAWGSVLGGGEIA
jgi:hypothetical protein